jgi:hypothetical protein
VVDQSLANIPGVKELAAQYEARYPGPDQVFDVVAMSGYAAMAVAGKALETACRQKDLSRAGIVAAHHSVRSIDLGLGTVHDFSDATKPSSYKSYILRPKKTALGGLEMQEPAFEAPAVREYRIPEEH